MIGMKAFEFVDLLSFFHRRMLSENTGNAEQFASKLGISRASLYRLIDDLQDYGIEIEYSRERNTYRYLYRNNVRITILIAQLSDDEMKKEKEKSVFV